MKTTALCLALFLTAGTTSLFAQNRMGGGQRQQMMRTYLTDSVKLSDALADSVISIGQQYQPQMREIFMDQSASREDKQTKMESLRTEMETRYKSAGLTDDQIKMIRDRENRMRARMQNRMNNG